MLTGLWGRGHAPLTTCGSQGMQGGAGGHGVAGRAGLRAGSRVPPELDSERPSLLCGTDLAALDRAVGAPPIIPKWEAGPWTGTVVVGGPSRWLLTCGCPLPHEQGP